MEKQQVEVSGDRLMAVAKASRHEMVFGRFVISEGSAELYGVYRFSLDRRVEGRLENIGWYKSYDHTRQAMAAAKLEA